MKHLTAAFLIPALLAPLMATAAVPDDPLESPNWIYMAAKFFKGDTVVFDDRVRVQAPEYAENSLETPVQISAPDLPNVKQVLVFADLNPITKILEYYPVRAQPSIGFAFKIQQATPLRAAMRTADGVWHVGGVWIDAQGGGCTAPSVASGSPIWQTQLGETEARLWSPDADNKHARERLKFRIIHPMDTGLAAGIPAFYISEVTVTDANGDVLARVKPNEPVAENPVITLDLGASGPVTLSGRDINGNRFHSQVTGPAS